MSFLLLLLMIIIITISILIIIIIMIIIDVCTGLSDYQPWIIYIYICIHTYIHTYIHIYIYIHTDRMIIITNIHLHARPTWNCLQASSPRSGPRGPCWTPVLWDIIFVNWKIDVE